MSVWCPRKYIIMATIAKTKMRLKYSEMHKSISRLFYQLSAWVGPSGMVTTEASICQWWWDHPGLFHQLLSLSGSDLDSHHWYQHIKGGGTVLDCSISSQLEWEFSGWSLLEPKHVRHGGTSGAMTFSWFAYILLNLYSKIITFLLRRDILLMKT
jgi:hypothetical protein